MITPVQAVGQQAAPIAAAAPTVAPVSPATPVAPMEPGKRVTANRESGRGDLQSQQQSQKASQPQTRGRLIDLSV